MHPLTWLVLFTLVIVVAIAAWQLLVVRKSQRKRGETKAAGSKFGPDS